MRHTYSFPVSRNTWIILVASSRASGSTPVTIGFLQPEDRLLESHHGPRVSAPASSPPMQPLHGSTAPTAIEVDQAKANVLVERTLFRDTSEGWISLLLYLVQYVLFPLPGSFLPWD